MSGTKMLVRLLVLVAIVLAGCGPGTGGGGDDPGSSAPAPGSRFSEMSSTEAEAMLKRWVEGVARAALPDAAWTFEPPGSEGAYQATGCSDELGRPTGYRTIPYSAKTPFPTGDDAVTAAGILDRAEAYLRGEGFEVTRGKHNLVFGALNGSRDHFSVGIELPTITRLVLVTAGSPCVK